jgi:DNA-binding PadR family transcriptional regulator
MSLEHAILGFLNYRPLSGYDLKKAFDTSVRHFWAADQSQIYRTLARLADQGWAQVEIIEQDDRPDRKVYHITQAGQQELLRWLATPLPHQARRNASLVQVFLAGQLTDQEILALLEPEAEHLRNDLEHYRQVPQASQAYIEALHSPRGAFFWMLTLEYGSKVTQAQLDWVESVIQRIKNKQHPSR